MRTTAVRILLAAAVLAAAPAARAQFVQLTRCQAAYPCSVPFGLRYKPDPLLAAAYGNVPNTVFSGRIDPGRLLQTPVVDLSKAVENQDFARDAARVFVLRHPAPKATPAAPPDPADAAESPKR